MDTRIQANRKGEKKNKRARSKWASNAGLNIYADVDLATLGLHFAFSSTDNPIEVLPSASCKSVRQYALYAQCLLSFCDDCSCHMSAE